MSRESKILFGYHLDLFVNQSGDPWLWGGEDSALNFDAWGDNQPNLAGKNLRAILQLPGMNFNDVLQEKLSAFACEKQP